MTPGQRHRLDRRYARNEAGKAVREFKRENEVPNLRELPHPKGRLGTAHDYVEWLVDNGYRGHALRYLKSLL